MSVAGKYRRKKLYRHNVHTRATLRTRLQHLSSKLWDTVPSVFRASHLRYILNIETTKWHFSTCVKRLRNNTCTSMYHLENNFFVRFSSLFLILVSY